MREVYSTIFEAVALVVLVIVLFLQSWRAAIMPIAAIPVSLDRHLRRHVGCRLLAQHPVALRPGAGDRHRGGRRHRGGGERRAQHRARAWLRGRRAATHGRGGRRRRRHHAGAAGGVRPDGLHRRHHRASSSAVRAHHRRADGHLGLQLPDALSPALGACCSKPRTATVPWRRWAALLPRLQRGLRSLYDGYCRSVGIVGAPGSRCWSSPRLLGGTARRAGCPEASSRRGPGLPDHRRQLPEARRSSAPTR